MQLWHVTKKSALPKILRKGLRPAIGPRSKSLGEMHPAVYFFPSRDDCEDALGSWMADVFEDIPDGGLVILEIELPAGIPVITKVGFEVEVRTGIPAECIQRVFNEDWTPAARYNSQLRAAA